MRDPQGIKKGHSRTVCPVCGYDRSCDYAEYPTLTTIPNGALSEKQRIIIEMNQKIGAQSQIKEEVKRLQDELDQEKEKTANVEKELREKQRESSELRREITLTYDRENALRQQQERMAEAFRQNNLTAANRLNTLEMQCKTWKEQAEQASAERNRLNAIVQEKAELELTVENHKNKLRKLQEQVQILQEEKSSFLSDYRIDRLEKKCQKWKNHAEKSQSEYQQLLEKNEATVQKLAEAQNYLDEADEELKKAKDEISATRKIKTIAISTSVLLFSVIILYLLYRWAVATSILNVCRIIGMSISLCLSIAILYLIFYEGVGYTIQTVIEGIVDRDGRPWMIIALFIVLLPFFLFLRLSYYPNIIAKPVNAALLSLGHSPALTERYYEDRTWLGVYSMAGDVMRAHPDGTVEIKHPDGTSEELLPTSLTLDAEQLILHPGDVKVLTAENTLGTWSRFLSWSVSEGGEQVVQMMLLNDGIAQVEYVSTGECRISVHVIIPHVDTSKLPQANCEIVCEP